MKESLVLSPEAVNISSALVAVLPKITKSKDVPGSKQSFGRRKSRGSKGKSVDDLRASLDRNLKRLEVVQEELVIVNSSLADAEKMEDDRKKSKYSKRFSELQYKHGKFTAKVARRKAELADRGITC